MPTNGESIELVARAGQAIVLVGANGSGKSALCTWLSASAQRNDRPIRRLLGHRQIWIEQDTGMTSAQRGSIARNVEQWDANMSSRWRDDAATRRFPLALHDLAGQEMDRNTRIATAHDDGRVMDEVDFGPSPLGRINVILRRAGMRVRLSIQGLGVFYSITPEGTSIPIASLSDGEKGAILLAAEVLIAPEGSILFLDEPERHLHRSVSAQLIAAVLAERHDCSFVIATHDLDLAASLPTDITTALALRSCAWEADAPTWWDADLLGSEDDIPDEIRRVVLGGRNRLLFVEGDAGSIDVQLLRPLFPDWDIIPAGGCRSVIARVSGLRALGHLHWIEARGLIDGDRRSEEERTKLLGTGIVVMGLNEIESALYLDEVISSVAATQAVAEGVDPSDLIADVRRSALDALGQPGVRQHLASVAAESEIARAIGFETPHRSEIPERGDSIVIKLPSPFKAQMGTFESALNDEDLDGIVRHYPIRDSPMRSRVASALGFSSHAVYERVARRTILAVPALADALRAVIYPSGTLTAADETVGFNDAEVEEPD